MPILRSRPLPARHRRRPSALPPRAGPVQAPRAGRPGLGRPPATRRPRAGRARVARTRPATGPPAWPPLFPPPPGPATRRPVGRIGSDRLPGLAGRHRPIEIDGPEGGSQGPGRRWQDGGARVQQDRRDIMSTVKATVRGGRIEVRVPDELPDGTEVLVEVT